ncbi:hypothetical protein EV182_005914, partial [Spiromyces aspiralis]
MMQILSKAVQSVNYLALFQNAINNPRHFLGQAIMWYFVLRTTLRLTRRMAVQGVMGTAKWLLRGVGG